jgi:hypothetical protein
MAIYICLKLDAKEGSMDSRYAQPTDYIPVDDKGASID